MAKKYASHLADAVRQYLDAKEFKYQFDDARGRFRLTMTLGDSKLRSVDLFINVGERYIQVFGVAPINTPQESFGRVMEYFARINWAVRPGKFVIDLSDGETRFESSLEVQDSPPDQQKIKFIIELILVMWYQFGNGYIKILYSDVSPLAAFEEARQLGDDAQ